MLWENSSDILGPLLEANARFAKAYPGDRPDRQPVHTVYGGAQLFKASTTKRLGELALRNLQLYAPDAKVFGEALHIDPSVQKSVYERVTAKLTSEPVEDFRIDFEDGYGSRPDEEEDEDAARTAREVALGMDEGSLSPFIGIRIKTFTEELHKRSMRTLELFLTTLAQETGGKLPENFVVTLPKVTHPEQVTALVRLFEKIEENTQIEAGALKLELMIETTQSIFGADGRVTMPLLYRAAEGRCTGCHFGTYDYTASCSVTAAFQTMDHQVCDFAKNVMRNSLAGTGVWLSDGATNVMPVPIHRGDSLSDEQQRENVEAVHDAWRLAYGHIQHSLKNGFYQGWDLHPGQLPIRYAACYSFFLEGFAQAAERLKNFVEVAAQATLVGDVFDDAATGQGLLNYFLRALNCGAVTLDDLRITGLTIEEIRLRSFAKILAARTARA